MTTNSLEVVRRACIEANPEIMELKFGCEVVSKVSGTKGTILRKCTNSERYELRREGESGLYRESTAEFEILGRELRLADVLLALPNKYDSLTEFRNLIGDVALSWNLRNDSLSAQSPECIEFLASLLSKKK